MEEAEVDFLSDEQIEHLKKIFESGDERVVELVTQALKELSNILIDLEGEEDEEVYNYRRIG